MVLGTNTTTTTLVADHCYAVLSVSRTEASCSTIPGAPAETSPTPDPDLVSWNIIAQDGNEFFFDSSANDCGEAAGLGGTRLASAEFPVASLLRHCVTRSHRRDPDPVRALTHLLRHCVKWSRR